MTTMHEARRAGPADAGAGGPRARRGLTAALLALVIGMAGGAGRAEAQSAPWQPEPLTAGWSVTPGLAVGLFHDSNVRLRTARPGSGDWVALVHPRGEIDFVGRRTRFNAGYAGALQAFRSVEYLNRYQQRARLSSSRVLSPRLTVRGDASLLRSPTTDEAEDGTMPFAAVGLVAFSANGGLDATLSRRARLGGTYRFHRLEYDAIADLDLDVRLLRGGHAHAPGLRLGYDLTRRLSLTGDWTYTQGVVASQVGDFRLQEVGAGWAYRLREQTTIGAGGGATSVSVPAAGVRGWHPAVQAFAQQQAGPNTLSVQYRYSVVPAFSHGGLSQQQRVGTNVFVPLMAGRAWVAGSLAWSRNETLEGVGIGLDSRTVWLQGTVGYQLARWLRAETFVNTARQSALAHGDQSVQRTRIGLQFVTAKPMRID